MFPPTRTIILALVMIIACACAPIPPDQPHPYEDLMTQDHPALPGTNDINPCRSYGCNVRP